MRRGGTAIAAATVSFPGSWPSAAGFNRHQCNGVQSRSAAAGRDGQSGRRVVLPAPVRQGDACPALPEHAVVRRLRRVDPGDRCDAHRQRREPGHRDPDDSCTAGERLPDHLDVSVAPITDSTGDAKFVVPGSGLRPRAAPASPPDSRQRSTPSRRRAGTPRLSPDRRNLLVLPTSLTNPAPSTTPIQVAFDKKTNPFHVLVVPMGDATKTYSSQFGAAAQAAVQEGMTGTVARIFPLASGVGNLGSTGGEGLQYTITPTLLDLKSLGLLDRPGSSAARARATARSRDSSSRC